jgi:hypothetical protein
MREVIGANPRTRTVTKSGRRELPGRLPGTSGRITGEFLRHRGSTRKRLPTSRLRYASWPLLRPRTAIRSSWSTLNILSP